MPNELLERKIDTNRTGIQAQELLNFVKDTKNLQELGNHLNKVGPNRSDALFVLSQQEVQKYFPSISQKIKANKPLTENEKSVMKIQYVIEKKAIPTNESELNTYLGSKFNNLFYGVKAVPQKVNLYLKGTGENTEIRELTSFERKLQVQSILQAGQYYIQFLQDKGIGQPLHSGDTPNHIVYFNELQAKLSKGTALSDADVVFYIHQIFYDFSMSGAGYSKKAGTAYKGIDKILTSKEGRTKKNIKNKLIEVLYQVRQIDAAKGMKYKSADMLLNTLMQDVASYKLQRGPESYKLTSSLMGMSLLKPLETGEFVDPLVAKMYSKLKNPSKDVFVSMNGGRGGNALENGNYGDNDIFAVFKKYKLPHEGASISEMYKLQVQLINAIEPLKKKERSEKESIKKLIITQKTEEIKNQNIQKEILKKEFLKRKIDVTNPNAQNALAYFDAQITLNTKLIKGESIDIGSTDGKPKKVNLQQIVDAQYKVMENKLISDIVQKGIIYEVLQANKETTNFIRDMKKSGTALTSDEKAVDMLADITGAGVYRSDETFNTAVEVSKELAIQVALMAISGGIANIAARGTLLAIQGGAEFLGAGVYAARVARYANLGKTAFWSSVKFAPELFAADIIAEGTVFHLVNTTLNAPLQGLSGKEYLNTINPFGTQEELQADGTTKTVSSMMGYAESVAFMGVMKGFGSLTNQITKSLGGKTLNVAQQSQTIKNVLTANLITLPGEIVSMQGTSAIVGLTFGHDVDLTPQSWAQTLAMVIGLRISHMGTGSLGKISQTIDGKIQEKSMKQGTLDISKVIYDKAGNVQSVEYRVLDATGKVLDQGTASQKTIESAMKEKKGKKEKAPIKEEGIIKLENGSMQLAVTSLEIQKNSEKISEVLASGDAQKFSVVMKEIRSNRQNMGWKDALSTLKQTTSVYKTELLDGIELLKANIHTNPELAFEGLQKISTNGLKLGILLFNCLPVSPIPGNRVLLLGLIATEFKTKGPMYEAIIELHAALKEKGIAQISLNESTIKETKSTISPEIVKSNAELSPEARIEKAKELLGNLTSAQEKAILDAHNQPGEIYNLNFSEIRVRTEILKKAGFSREQVKVLMENGICGKGEVGNIIVQRKINGDDFDFPMKKGKVEYKKTNPNGTTEEASLGEITIQQAKECFLNGLSVSADMFKGQNWVVLSSGSLFLNVEGYRKLGGDIDIATDVQTFINLALEKTNGVTTLDKFLKEGKIQDLEFTKIDHTRIDIPGLTEEEINDYINKGDIRVEFNIKSKDGFLINTEFFPEPAGHGLIQLGTERTVGKVKEYTIEGKKIRTVDEELAAKSYLINLAHEIDNNSLDGLSKGKKLKDSIRINNIFEHLVSLGIKVPEDMIGFIQETISDYKSQPGLNGKMCKYLEDGLVGLEKTKEIFKDINNDYNIVKENSLSRGTKTMISFNDFINKTYEIKKELLNIQNNNQKIPDKIYNEIMELQSKINIKDPKSFAYYYELYQLRSNFIMPISNKL